MKTLEAEFLQYKMIHKYSILRAALIKFYSDIILPLDKKPEDMADEILKELIDKRDNLQTFNKMYELAYNIIAPLAEF